MLLSKAYLVQNDGLILKKKYEEVVALLEKIIPLFPDDELVKTLLRDSAELQIPIYLNQQKFDEAIRLPIKKYASTSLN